MFFSIIIPTYNPKKYLNNILESITKSDCKDDIEVIISDDCSTEDFSDIIEKYSDILSIITIQNESHYGAPMKGRQHGAETATGQWICFADQDDYFTDHAFDYVKECIEKEKAHNYLITDFYEKTQDGELKEMIHTLNWTHGKFYERKFWNKYNIGYTETKYCEDMSLSVFVSCVLAENKLDDYYFPCFTYTWVGHPESLSKMNGLSNDGYFYRSMPDYIRITLGRYVSQFEKCEKTQDNLNFYVNNIVSNILHLYFYHQGLTWQDDGDLQAFENLTRQYYLDFLRISESTNEQFKNFVWDNLDMYKDIREVCFSQVPFIEKQSFFDWIDFINEKEVIV